ncbi:MAG: hypothetical protein GF401_12075 [Chitinivibrionales bacterium]|nr:hypothetical protein [Chitinivibrionales bacterium]
MGKNHRFYSFIFMLLLLAVSSQGFTLIKQSGQVLHFAKGASDWVAAEDSNEFSYGDSIFIDSAGEAKLVLSKSATLLLKGTTRISIEGADLTPIIGLVQGQVFLSREQPYELNSVVVNARGCTIQPIGTAAAVKYTPSGEPTVACIKGRMRMEAPSGEAILVEPRKYGTFAPNDGSFKQGDLSDNAVASLESWSGVTAESAPMQQDEPSASDANEQEETLESETMQTAQMAQEPEKEEPSETGAEEPEDALEETGSDDAASEEKPAQKEASAAPASGSAPPPGNAAANAQAEKKEEPAGEEKKESEEGKGADKTSFGFSAGPVSVGDEMWTRIAFLADIPIWKFGIGLDVELFINSEGKFDPKGWEFDEDTWAKSLLRKIRYIRFNHENDPVFAKFGGLDNVTLAYGFIVDRFNNTLHYPDDRRIGLQFYLNDLSPIGISLQTVVADFYDFKNDGGIVGGRFAVKPLKPTEIPLLKGIDIGVLFMTDRNQYAPAREWDYSLSGPTWDRDQDNIFDSTFWRNEFGNKSYVIYDSLRADKMEDNNYDTIIEHKDKWASRAEDAYSMFGFDATMPIISTKLVNFAVYGQYGMSIDDHEESNVDNTATEGWGIGAPGAALNVGPLSARLEYRHTAGDFTPGYFGPYYFDERIEREIINDSIRRITVREDDVIEQNLNGIYGSLGFNIANAFTITGTYQYLIGEAETEGAEDPLDHRFELNGGIGDLVISKIPKLYKAEAYLYKTNIGRNVNPVTGETDGFLAPTPSMYYGYRMGFEIMPGAGIIWDARYGFEYGSNGDIVQKPSNVSIQASMVF